MKCYIEKTSQGCVALHSHREGDDRNLDLLLCGSFPLHNREQEKVPTYQHLCLTDTAPLYAVYLLNAIVDPFYRFSFLSSIPPLVETSSVLILLKSCSYLFEAGDKSCTKVEWLKILLSDILFLTKLFLCNFFFIHYILIEPEFNKCLDNTPRHMV